MKLLNSQQQLFQKQKELFLKSLYRGRSKFIEYFLISGWDPITVLDKKDINSYQIFIKTLYVKSYEKMKNKVFFAAMLVIFSIETFSFSTEPSKSCNNIIW